MFSPPSTPTWARMEDPGSPGSDYSKKIDRNITDTKYPDDKYKQSPIPSPNASWGLQSYQHNQAHNQSALVTSDGESEYVRFDPLPQSHAYTDIHQGYEPITSLRKPVDLPNSQNPVPSRQDAPGQTVEPLPIRQPGRNGSLLDIPDIPLAVHSNSDFFLREKNREHRKDPSDGDSDIYLQSGKGMPYNTLCTMKRSIADPRSPCFIPGASIDVSVIDVLNTDLLARPSKTYTYAVQVINGEFKWILRKTFGQWRNLHKALKILQQKLAGDFGQTFPGYTVKTDADLSILPRFPTIEKESVLPADLPGRMHAFSKYLEYLMENSICRNHHAVRHFLEISPYSLIYGLGSKMKESYVMQRISDVPLKSFPVSLICGNISDGAKWLERWLVLKETCIFVIDPFDASVKDVILADRHYFEIKGGLKETGIPRGLLVSGPKSSLVFQCAAEKDVNEFVMELTFLKHVTAKDYTAKNEHSSFAPRRTNCYVKWLPDCRAYYKSAADIMQNSQEDIFICCEWLNLELQLKKSNPDEEGYWRLDNLLARKASQGVRIFILLGGQENSASNDSSSTVRHTLEDLYPGRVHVISQENMAWKHNEKFIVIDQSVALIGGMDLHLDLLDNIPKRVSEACWENVTALAFPNIHEVSPSRVKICKTEKAYKNCPFNDLSKDPGTPEDIIRACAARAWLGKNGKVRTSSALKDRRDVPHTDDEMREGRSETVKYPRASTQQCHGMGVLMAGSSAADLARHFIYSWNLRKGSPSRDLDTARTHHLLLPKVTRELHGIDDKFICQKAVQGCTVQILRSLGTWSGDLPSGEPEDSIREAMIKLIETSQQYIYLETEVFISSVNNEVGQITNRICASLVRRILRAYHTRQNFRVYITLPPKPTFGDRSSDSNESVARSISYWQYESICRGQYSLVAELSRHMPIQLIPEFFCVFGLRKFDFRDGKLTTEIIHNKTNTMIVDDRHVLTGSCNISDRSLKGSRNSEIACLISDETFMDSVMNGARYQAGKFAGSLRLRLMREHLGYLGSCSSTTREVFRDPVCSTFWKDFWLPAARRNTTIFEQDPLEPRNMGIDRGNERIILVQRYDCFYFTTPVRSFKVFSCTPSDEVGDFIELEFWERRPKLADIDPDTAQRALADVQGHLVIFPLGFLRNERLRPTILSKDGIMPASLWT